MKEGKGIPVHSVGKNLAREKGFHCQQITEVQFFENKKKSPSQPTAMSLSNPILCTFGVKLSKLKPLTY